MSTLKFNIRLLSLIMLMAVLAGSCVTRNRCAKYFPPSIVKTDSVKVTVVDHVRDTVIRIASDSSWIKYLVECDSNRRATIKELIQYKDGHRAQLPLVSLHNNVLTADCHCDSARIHALLKERETITDNQSSETITPPPIEVKYIPGWMWFFGITGMISWGAIIILVVFTLIKRKI